MADRLSNLPDPLIHTIFSFMEPAEMVRTTVLSKRWEETWKTVPYLRFQTHRDDGVLSDDASRIIQHWRGKVIRKLNLEIRSDTTFDSDILDSWVGFGVDKNVQDLSITFITFFMGSYVFPPPQPLYSLPEALCSCSFIKELGFFNGSLEIKNTVSWNQLKVLTIDCNNPLTETMIPMILEGSPCLECFNLRFPETSGNLKIESQSLIKLEINRFKVRSLWKNSTLEIGAPKLTILEMVGLPYGDILMNVPSITEICVDLWVPKDAKVVYKESLEKTMRRILQRCIRHAERVVLSNNCSQIVNRLCKNDVPVTSSAKFLKFYSILTNDMLGILEVFPLVTELVIVHRFKSHRGTWPPNPEKLQFPMGVRFPHLQHLRVEVLWKALYYPVDRVVEFVLQNAPMLERVVIHLVFPKGHNIDELVDWAERLRVRMHSPFPNAEMIVIEG